MNTHVDIHVAGMVKEEERYIVMYRDHSRAAALRTLGRWAANPELSFTWLDAAKLSQTIRAEVGA